MSVKMRKRFGILALALIASLVLAACGSKPAEAPKSSGTTAPSTSGSTTTTPAPAPAKPATPKVQGKVIYVTSGDPVNFNPILQSDTTSGWVTDRVFSGLVQIDEKLQASPDLATEWTASPDGLQWTFKLRQGVKFHDGKELTAEDVAYTFNSIKDKGYTGPRSSTFASLEKVEVVDKYTAKFILKEPFSPLLTSLTYGILPKHLYDSKPVAEMKDNPVNRKPIGTGPWKFGEWVTGQHIVLTRNDEYFGGKEQPYIPEMRLVFVKDSNVQVAKLEAGEVDYLAIPSKEIKRITTDYKGKFNFIQYQALGFDYMAFNMTLDGLKDKNVRQAIAYALDRQKMIDDILEGQAVIMHAPMPPGSWAFSDNTTKYAYDPKKGMAMLEQAGYTKGADGIYQKDGKRLSFKLITNSGNVTRESLALVVQKNLKDIGIEIKTDFIEWSVFLEKHLWVGNFDMFISGFSLGVDPDQYVLFHSSQADKNDKGRFKGFNRAQYRNSEVDKLLEEGRKVSDQAKRKEIYAKYQQILSDEIPWLLFYNNKSTVALKPYIKGVTESPQGPVVYRERWYSEQP